MPPLLALLVWLILLVALLYFDPAKDPKTSPALWLPVIWMFIVGSRLPAQWFDLGFSVEFSQDGNPLDRSVDLVLIGLSVAVLMSRSFKWGSFLRRNMVLTAYISFALLSVLWSDFPLVTFKRWFRDFGSYLVILVALTDPDPLSAVRTVLRRVSYLLIPLSIILDKYFPQIGRQYETWSGVEYYIGVTTSKNMLGLACLVSGLFFFWDTVTRWHDRKQRKTRRILAVNAAFLAMTATLLQSSQSTTARVCFVMGCMVILAAHSKVFRRHPAILKAIIPASFGIFLILDLGFAMGGSLAQAVGKDPTLTDRTKIWAFLFGMHTNPIIGTGYQSFWLGSRLKYFWDNAGLGPLNEAHNGYLEVYLELGLIGVILLVGFLIASYWVICKRLTSSSSLAVLGLATWLVLVFYNMSEAGFNGGLLYLLLLMSALAVPARARKRVWNLAAIDNAHTVNSVPDTPLGVTGMPAAGWPKR
jgi:exopolysaccharide production protein ExoQ